ncbi:unnamed protein product [Alopecurus aequalis]
MDPSAGEPKDETLFREYIGAQGQGITFQDVLGYYEEFNGKGVGKFDLILAFAIDYDKTTKQPTQGKFRAFWDETLLTPEAVAAFKRGRPNVRVMLSIGGATIYGDEGAQVKFTPATHDLEWANKWIDNAVDSLGALMHEYHLDGIDIDYEVFEEVSEDTTQRFVHCITGLLQRLKLKEEFKDKHIVTSIAPHYEPKAQANYQALWQSCRADKLIDYVNFQFYSNDLNLSPNAGILQPREYAETVYFKQMRNYPDAKVLASINTLNPIHNKRGLQARDALRMAWRLHQEHKLPGIFFWSADSSFGDYRSQPEGEMFQHEKEALRMVMSKRVHGCF